MDDIGDDVGDDSGLPEGPVCGRCYDAAPVFRASCAHKPESLVGEPLGMYHCPDCGAMVLAGLPHLPLCERCNTRTHPSFDGPRP